MTSEATQITQLVNQRDDLPTSWGRWGEHDERGTLNLTTDQVRAAFLFVAAPLPLGAASGAPVSPLAIF